MRMPHLFIDLDMIPDKIYIGTVTLVEYIRKDALIEWIQEVRAIPHENAITRDLTFQEVVNKLNSM